jgi:hypothetical protein
VPPPRSRADQTTLAAALAAAVVGLIPFFWSTTFFTDDHLLLAFARYTPNPLAAFRHDLHGGEFYRPLSMSLWWLQARIGGGAIWPFAVVAAALHALVAFQVAWLARALGGDRAAALCAGAFFWLSPQTREAALWFAAFPDLLGTALVLGSLLALLSGRSAVAVAFAACAYLSKESTIVLPALAALVWTARPASGPATLPSLRRVSATLIALAVLAALAVAYLLVRHRVLHGWGGFSDEHASLSGKLVQVVSGLVHVVAGADVFPEALAWGVGVSVPCVALFGVARRARAGDLDWRQVAAPLAFTAVAVAPLFAVGWIIGARYFYLPSVGLALLVGQALGPAAAAWRGAGVLAMLALGGIQAVARHHDVTSYDRRVDAARRAVADGVAHGYRVFHIAAGIKDLDLAVKESPVLRAAEDRVLVLGDVPASFVAIPDDLQASAAFLVASPPFPPSGAYQFGGRRVVGLARRGDDPTMDEVFSHFPDLRIIRLRPTPGGRIIARDVTEEIKQSPPDP